MSGWDAQGQHARSERSLQRMLDLLAVFCLTKPLQTILFTIETVNQATLSLNGLMHLSMT